MTDIEYLEKYYKGNLDDAISTLNKGIRVQYIVGDVDFYGINLNVNPSVLIPRFETEELVFKVLELAKNFDNPRIADIGTGSGAIAIALKKKLNCDMVATDISEEALNVARENALKNDVSIDFRLGNLLEPLDGKFDIIVSNPPYIAYDEEIMEIVKNNEPHIALYADNDGLYYYEEILKNIRNITKDKYLICFEIGATQGKKIIDITNRYLNNINITLEKDYANLDRYIFITNIEE